MAPEMSAFNTFTALGGKFHIPEADFKSLVLNTRAFIFDWDGVFTDGRKHAGLSSFSEVDSMGLNMLRFGWYLLTGEVPVFAIITGLNNITAIEFAQRENFSCIYQGFKNKKLALDHLAANYSVSPGSCAFFFDDILDLSIAPLTGLRFMVERDCNPGFNSYVYQNKMADYSTFSGPGNNALRECAELCLMAAGVWEHSLEHRIAYTLEYSTYWKSRLNIRPISYFFENERIISG
jgi:3-deoxy-D-manno-octulosonate 8-phosphate phosphatase (KDO 8-P phosphatase)